MARFEDELVMLKRLRDSGHLTSERFERAFGELMERARLSPGTGEPPTPLGEGPQPEDWIGSYQLLERLGAGGMGVVFRARHRVAPKARQQGGDVALKFMHAHLAVDAGIRARFEREAAALIELKHPGIVRGFDLVTDGDTPGLVMELLRGPDLAQLLRLAPPPWAVAVARFDALLDAVRYAHTQDVIHRDLKPSNIVATDAGPWKVLDFGLVKPLESIDAGLTATSQALGSHAYMAPEQALDARTADLRTDIYALGVILYELLTGDRAWERASSPYQLYDWKREERLVDLQRTPSGVPLELVQVAWQAARYEPRERFGSVAAMQTALRLVKDRAERQAAMVKRKDEMASSVVFVGRAVKPEPEAAAQPQQAAAQKAPDRLVGARRLDPPVDRPQLHDDGRAGPAAPEPSSEERDDEAAGVVDVQAGNVDDEVFDVDELESYAEDSFGDDGHDERTTQQTRRRRLPLLLAGGISTVAVGGAVLIALLITVVGLISSMDDDELEAIHAEKANTLTPASSEPLEPEPERLNPAGIDWVTIPGGSFEMGATLSDKMSRDNEHPQHHVTVPGFEMSRSEVTFGQYQSCVDAVACTSPHVSDGTCYVDNWSTKKGVLPQDSQGSEQPVVCVDWEQAKTFAAWVDGRLPTEAEWEYAARGGQDFIYAGSNVADDVAWYYGNSTRRVQTVCGKQRNGYELCDLSGNVWEWVGDSYHPSYSRAPSDGSPWTTGGGNSRVWRGGSYFNSGHYTRVTKRYWSTPEHCRANLGIRLVK